ncbi:putative 5'-3' exoribonuclease 1 [Blattamonas nauphoetae]|uniref:5'-3' exoribonuclease 1 n=1 Tax=Blattamonas nauphoetae TaxID=2049346 RepID=A0ABQ9YAV1_9EUKA|nr:putative 5'-3' exoribonuclease 1 [Blattamonas nauphoetae]
MKSTPDVNKEAALDFAVLELLKRFSITAASPEHLKLYIFSFSDDKAIDVLTGTDCRVFKGDINVPSGTAAFFGGKWIIEPSRMKVFGEDGVDLTFNPIKFNSSLRDEEEQKLRQRQHAQMLDEQAKARKRLVQLDIILFRDDIDHQPPVRPVEFSRFTERTEMGIPKLFRWISERYPLILSNADAFGTPDIDNLYLDSNGIIHNATHGNAGVIGQLSEEDMIAGIFEYIDRLVQIARPKKLLYIAVDGVGPRAKLNQQRSRRFRAARDREEAVTEMRRKGITPPKAVFDSNCITPGSEFMYHLSDWLKYYTKLKMSTDKAWEGITVILSGCDVPGEGEHKIMSYIRAQKDRPDFDPSTTHCIYGQDADLIMLSLATHQPHFVILREEVKFNTPGKPQEKLTLEKTPFQYLHVGILREYLQMEFQAIKNKIQFPYDFERIVDDFVLLCFFVGNDFIPKMPGLDIAQGSLSLIFETYCTLLPTFNDYLTLDGTINWDGFERICAHLAIEEQRLFVEEYAQSEFEASAARPMSNGSKFVPQFSNPTDLQSFTLRSIDSLEDRIRNPPWRTSYYRRKFEYDPPALFLSDTALDNREDQHVFQNDPYFFDHITTESESNHRRTCLDHSDHRAVIRAYLESIVWVFQYYYCGCPSWSWYFPYLYAPLLCDLVQLKETASSPPIAFNEDKPLLPFEQLLSVLPSLSSALLPVPFRSLMTDPQSPLVSYYPSNFEVDMEFTKTPWEGVCKLPFIDPTILVEECRKIYPQLSQTEKERNVLRFNSLFRSSHHPTVLALHLTPQQVDSLFPAYILAAPTIHQAFRSLSRCRIVEQKAQRHCVRPFYSDSDLENRFGKAERKNPTLWISLTPQQATRALGSLFESLPWRETGVPFKPTILPGVIPRPRFPSIHSLRPSSLDFFIKTSQPPRLVSILIDTPNTQKQSESPVPTTATPIHQKLLRIARKNDSDPLATVVPVTPKIDSVKMIVFNRPSRNPSLVLEVDNPMTLNGVTYNQRGQRLRQSPQGMNVDSTLSYAIRFLVGCGCNYNWPHLRPGRIYRVDAVGVSWVLNEQAMREEEKMRRQGLLNEDDYEIEQMITESLLNSSNQLSSDNLLPSSILTRLSDAHKARILKRSVPNDPPPASQHWNYCSSVEQHLLQRRGIDCGECSILCFIHPLESLRVTSKLSDVDENPTMSVCGLTPLNSSFHAPPTSSKRNVRIIPEYNMGSPAVFPIQLLSALPNITDPRFLVLTLSNIARKKQGQSGLDTEEAKLDDPFAEGKYAIIAGTELVIEKVEVLTEKERILQKAGEIDESGEGGQDDGEDVKIAVAEIKESIVESTVLPETSILHPLSLLSAQCVIIGKEGDDKVRVQIEQHLNKSDYTDPNTGQTSDAYSVVPSSLLRTIQTLTDRKSGKIPDLAIIPPAFSLFPFMLQPNQSSFRNWYRMGDASRTLGITPTALRTVCRSFTLKIDNPFMRRGRGRRQNDDSDPPSPSPIIATNDTPLARLLSSVKPDTTPSPTQTQKEEKKDDVPAEYMTQEHFYFEFGFRFIDIDNNSHSPFYARFNSSPNTRDWEISQECLILMDEYFTKFPFVFTFCAEGRLPREYRSIQLEDIGDISLNKLEEHKRWLESKKERKMPTYPNHTLLIDDNGCTKVEEFVSEVGLSCEPSTSTEAVPVRVTAVVPISCLVPGVTNTAIDASTSLGGLFHVGDRVVNASLTGSIPFGSRGTVVSCTIHTQSYNETNETTQNTQIAIPVVENAFPLAGASKTNPNGSQSMTSRISNPLNSVDVIWDADMMGGTSLYGRCTPGRGTTTSNRWLFRYASFSKHRMGTGVKDSHDLATSELNALLASRPSTINDEAIKRAVNTFRTVMKQKVPILATTRLTMYKGKGESPQISLKREVMMKGLEMDCLVPVVITKAAATPVTLGPYLNFNTLPSNQNPAYSAPSTLRNNTPNRQVRGPTQYQPQQTVYQPQQTVYQPQQNTYRPNQTQQNQPASRGREEFRSFGGETYNAVPPPSSLNTRSQPLTQSEKKIVVSYTPGQSVEKGTTQPVQVEQPKVQKKVVQSFYARMKEKKEEKAEDKKDEQKPEQQPQQPQPQPKKGPLIARPTIARPAQKEPESENEKTARVSSSSPIASVTPPAVTPPSVTPLSTLPSILTAPTSQQSILAAPTITSIPIINTANKISFSLNQNTIFQPSSWTPGEISQDGDANLTDITFGDPDEQPQPPARRSNENVSPPITFGVNTISFSAAPQPSLLPPPSSSPKKLKSFYKPKTDAPALLVTPVASAPLSLAPQPAQLASPSKAFSASAAPFVPRSAKTGVSALASSFPTKEEQEKKKKKSENDLLDLLDEVTDTKTFSHFTRRQWTQG